MDPNLSSVIQIFVGGLVLGCMAWALIEILAAVFSSSEEEKIRNYDYRKNRRNQ